MQTEAINEFLTQAQAFLFSLVIALLALGGFVILLYFIFLLWKYRHREERALNSVLLQIALPKDNEIKIDAAEQMFASLHSLTKSGFFSFLKLQEHLSFEIVGLPEDIRFYVHCPKNIQDLVEKQINGAYPGADIKEVEEYNLFGEKGKVAFASLKLKNVNYYPLKIYKDLPTDPLSLMTSALAKMGEGEGAAIQILISPVNSKWQSIGRGYIGKIKRREADPEKARFTVDQKILEAIEQKCSKPGFATCIRLVVASATKEQASAHLQNLTAVFEQFANDLNSFKKARLFSKRSFMIDFIYRYFPTISVPFFGKTGILNSEELATIFHFPNKQVETPHLFWLNAKKAPAPQQISTSGLFLGESVYRGIKRPVYIEKGDRSRHIYIIGKTGVGKSELLKSMILQDIKNGEGVCFIDPHDTIDKILPLIPPERAEDVIYFDPSDTERPLGLNMIEAYTEQQQHMVTTSIIGLMYKLYDPYKTGIIGPRFEHAIRNAILTVMAEPGSTFVEVVRCLTDSNFVQEILPKVQDPMVRRYWTDQIAQTADFHKSEVLDYIVSKFGRFVTNKLIRNIIGQSKTAFDFRKAMDEGKIILVNLAKGKIGEENTSFLGTIIVPKILMAAMSRTDVSEEKRRDFYLYVDEFQNFATPDFATMLSEARKYHLAITVANQFIGQMEEEVKNAVFGNVGTLIAFRVGVTDANFIQHEFQPVFNEADLINVDRYNAYIRTIVNMEAVPPFSVDMTKDLAAEEKAKNDKVAEAIKKLSALKYGKPKELIEAEIAQRSRL
ncbi:MAG: DUF87 domain-containing protein [Patescibacteria group bacterium]|nr:DUF87 domain-containing protein [Patescibacteria group bacterium]MCL5095740.1 DUF87 domain-containing protein [Patescibacteria group bacterium]